MVSIGILVGEGETVISCEKMSIIWNACCRGPCYARDGDSAFIEAYGCGYILIGSSSCVVCYRWDDRCFVDPMYRCGFASSISINIFKCKRKSIIPRKDMGEKSPIVGHCNGFITSGKCGYHVGIGIAIWTVGY